MTRKPLWACFAGIFIAAAPGVAHAQQSPPATQTSTAGQGTPPAVPMPDESQLGEEDESAAPEKFVLNPLESERNIRVGNYYWHKGKYRAALKRYQFATKYNPSSAEAFFKVAEAENKLSNPDAARAAFRRVVDLAPDSKLAHEAKKKLSSKS